MEILSKRMKDLREDADLIQSEMSAILDVSQSALSQYENGREPDLAYIIRYAEYFDVSINWLLGLTNEKKAIQNSDLKRIQIAQQLATKNGDVPFSISDIVRLADAFSTYYASGANCGSIPMDCFMSVLAALRNVLDAATIQDTAALLVACNEVAAAGLSINGALALFLESGKGENTETNNKEQMV